MNNQMFPQNAYTMCYPNQYYYPNNQGFMYYQNNNIQNQNYSKSKYDGYESKYCQPKYDEYEYEYESNY